MTVLVAVPVGDRTRVGGATTRGFAATRELRATFDLGDDADEEAEHAALLVASVAALSQFGARRVLMVEVDPTQIAPGDDLANGEVTISRLGDEQIGAWFAEAPEVDSSAAAQAAAGLSVDQAWDLPEVVDLLASHDMLWHDVTETDAERARAQ
jgi:hypothetical protein